jgi:sugar/nucleoside kinase (ribokinase family)
MTGPPAPATPVDVLGIGENSVDDVYTLPGWPAPGGLTKMRIASHGRHPGGQVATTLCTCAALGLSARYLGAFGDDDNARLVRAEMQRRGVDLEQAAVRHAPNRHAVILVDQTSRDRLVLWERDDALALAPADIPGDAIARARLLHVDAVDEDAAIHAARLGRRAGIPVTCDVDRVTERTHALVSAVTIPILAEGIAEALTGERDTGSALRALRREHDGLLCATRGPRGAALLEGETLHEVAGHRVAVVDTTGAGDVFRGAFIWALLRGHAPADVLRLANAAAAISCTREGAFGGIPASAEIRRFLETGF